jgi:hypothetical protein
MKELKSKKTGKITVYTEEEYAEIVNNKPELLDRFEITDIRTRPIFPITDNEIKLKKPNKK